jgi:SPP1 gp7 family putative phage head morphogenesis protein
MSTILGPNGRPYAKATAPDTGKIGFTGIRRSRGIINEEYLDKLSGVKRIAVYQRMRSDGMVQAALAAVRLPIMAASWTVEAAGKDANAIRARDLVEENLFNRLGECWEAEVRELCNSLIYGFHVSAKNWAVEKGTALLDQLVPVHPRTILGSSKRWDLDPQGRVQGCWQYGSDGETYREEYIPGRALLHLTNDPDYRDPEGRSLLRGAYKHWFFKDEFYRFDGIGAERSAVGTPYGKYPADTPKEKQDAFYESLQGIVSDEAGALMTEVGFEVANFSLQTKAYEGHKSIQHHNAEIARAFLAGFLTLGQEGNGGAFALSSDLTDLFLLCLEFFADYIAARINRNIIPELVGYNIATDQYPKLSATVARQSATALAGILRQLTAGVNPLVTPGEDIEDWVRELLQLPHRTAPRPQPTAVVDPTKAAADPGKDVSQDKDKKQLARERIELRVLQPAQRFEVAAYPELGTVAEQFHAAIVTHSRALQERVVRIAGLPAVATGTLSRPFNTRKRLSGGRISRFADDAPAGSFKLSAEQEAAVDAAIEKFIAQMVGAGQTEAGFTAGDTEDGTVQQYERLAHAVGVEEARRLTDAEAAAFQPTRESPEIKALLKGAFSRLSEGGKLRIGEQLSDIKDILTDGMLGGLSPLDVAADLADRFTTYEEYEWERLARTESAFAAVTGQLDEYKAEGVEELENLVSELACPICQAFAGTKVKVADAIPGENVAPFHPNCLDSTIPVVPETS